MIFLLAVTFSTLFVSQVCATANEPPCAGRYRQLASALHPGLEQKIGNVRFVTLDPSATLADLEAIHAAIEKANSFAADLPLPTNVTVMLQQSANKANFNLILTNVTLEERGLPHAIHEYGHVFALQLIERWPSLQKLADSRPLKSLTLSGKRDHKEAEYARVSAESVAAKRGTDATAREVALRRSQSAKEAMKRAAEKDKLYHEGQPQIQFDASDDEAWAAYQMSGFYQEISSDLLAELVFGSADRSDVIAKIVDQPRRGFFNEPQPSRRLVSMHEASHASRLFIGTRLKEDPTVRPKMFGAVLRAMMIELEERMGNPDLRELSDETVNRRFIEKLSAILDEATEKPL